MSCPVCGGVVPPATGKRARVYCDARCKHRAASWRLRKTVRPGVYRQGGEHEKRCKNGHDTSQRAQRVFVGKTYEQCKRCYDLRNRARRTTRKHYCRKNLHLMRGDNVGYRAYRDALFCKACAKITRHENRRIRFEELGYRIEHCAVDRCKAWVERSPVRQDGYLCPKHRHVFNVERRYGPSRAEFAATVGRHVRSVA